MVTQGIYLMPPNCTLMVKMITMVMHILPHTHTQTVQILNTFILGSNNTLLLKLF